LEDDEKCFGNSIFDGQDVDQIDLEFDRAITINHKFTLLNIDRTIREHGNKIDDFFRFTYDFFD
jgi:hypothetical protein